MEKYNIQVAISTLQSRLHTLTRPGIKFHPNSGESIILQFRQEIFKIEHKEETLIQLEEILKQIKQLKRRQALVDSWKLDVDDYFPFDYSLIGEELISAMKAKALIDLKEELAGYENEIKSVVKRLKQSKTLSPTNTHIAKKLTVEMTALEIAAFFRTMKDSSQFVEGTTYKELAEFIACNFSTKDQSNLSPKNMIKLVSSLKKVPLSIVADKFQNLQATSIRLKNMATRK